MSLRVSNSIEKNVIAVQGSAPLAIPANTLSVLALPSISGFRGEWAARYIQNVGAGYLYYAYGTVCSPANFNGIIGGAGALDSNGFGPGQQFDASNSPEAITVYSPTGTTIVVTQLKRIDNDTQPRLFAQPGGQQ